MASDQVDFSNPENACQNRKGSQFFSESEKNWEHEGWNFTPLPLIFILLTMDLSFVENTVEGVQLR